MLDTIQYLWDRFAEFICLIYPASKAFRSLVIAILGALGFHKTFYTVVGAFFTRKFPPAKQLHKYAILVPARNEESVIGNLLQSIRRQDYPADLLTVFVIADNCTDHTAEVARQNGAICYERFNDAERTKGFALKFLFERIEEDYGIDSFEGYFIFDADNLLNKDYISRMNDSFDAGEKIITSYRNTKNFDENWVASTYALHWIRSSRTRHRVRSLLRLATNIQGTGFLFANELVKDGWNYTSLTEDRAFTADAIAHGYMISYNDAAQFFDEQPTSLKIAMRQRIRWSKGHLQAFVESGGSLFKNIFVGNCFRDKSQKRKINGKTILDGIRHRFAAFDILSQMIPGVVFKLFLWLIVAFFFYGCVCYTNGIHSRIFGGSNFLYEIGRFVFHDPNVDLSAGPKAMGIGMLLSTMWFLLGKMAFDIENMLLAVYLFFIERKRIKKISLPKKALFCITWPTFDMIYRYSMYLALFMKVTWKPIPHTSKVTIEDIEGSPMEAVEPEGCVDAGAVAAYGGRHE